MGNISIFMTHDSRLTEIKQKPCEILVGSKQDLMRKIPRGESKIHSIVFLKSHCSLLVCNKQHVELVEPHVLTYCPWARMIETRTSSICKATFFMHSQFTTRHTTSRPATQWQILKTWRDAIVASQQYHCAALLNGGSLLSTINNLMKIAYHAAQFFARLPYCVAAARLTHDAQRVLRSTSLYVPL